MEKQLLTAKEARAIAEASRCQLNRLASEIECAVKENRTRIYWNVCDTAEVVVDNLVDTLTRIGYTVEKEFCDNIKDDGIGGTELTGLRIYW